MPRILARLSLTALLIVLISACATHSSSPGLAGHDLPWWETAGPCRMWHPSATLSPRPTSWEPGSPGNSMSAAGDCRSLQAILPDNAVLLSTP